MGKDTFLLNQCMLTLRELSQKHTTNDSLGMAVREFLNDSNHENPNQLNLNLEGLDLNGSEESET